MSDRTRADAVRNADVVLRAAGDLFDEAVPGDHVSVEAVAARAGVGKATVFRAFGDRVGLLRALMVERGADLVRRVDEGPAPLGPGTPATERLPAVLLGLLDLKLAHRALTLALEQSGAGAPYAGETYGWWHAVVTGLVGDVAGPDVPAAEVSFTAHALLAAVRSDLVEQLVGAEQRSPDDVRRDLLAHVERHVAALDPTP